MAAISALLVLIFTIKSLNGNINNPEKLYLQNAVPEPLNNTRGSKNDSLKLLGSILYNSENYTAAIPVLEQFVEYDNAEEPVYKLALGYSYMHTGIYPEADIIFSELAIDATLYTNRANWYKALLLLKQGNKKACVTQLQLLPENASDYNKAKELLTQLK